MVDRTRFYRDGGQVHDPARQARARLADRGKRRLGKLAPIRSARWRRCVLGAMLSGVAVLAAAQFALGRQTAAPASVHTLQTRNTMTKELPRIYVSNIDFARITACLDALSAVDAERLQRLADELDRADVRTPGDMPSGVVVMGSSVRFAIEPANQDLTLTLVYPDEVEGQPGRISVFAPVGSALLGLSVGARIEWPRPDGATQVITIKEVG
ncbi:nucleoside diphosphate kinase regulator [Massilia sp. HP4]|uniref:nucleoside diphosphate kinase regulator n=1 Tax=Massilia sp. HP4 TaxID=2562316 RepID=UPI001E28FA52|nr:nucleoside diphosphate kinase regulator [Massilia sp. HP4]